MNKILRYSLVALFAMIMGNVYAEDIIWQEDFSSYEKNDVPSGGTYNYACVGSGTKIYSEKFAGGTAPELLIGKNDGSFAATITLNGKNGEMNLSYMANYDRITVTASEGATLGEKTKSGNNYVIPVTIASGASSITLTFTNSTISNVRFDDVKLYQGSAKKNPGLSWGTASRTVTIGSNDNTFPTLTNNNNLSVTYTSSETSVATIAADGTITLVTAGTTVIKAEFAGNDEYEAGSAEYTLTVKAAADPSAKGGENNPYTVAEALAAINELGAGNTASDYSYTKGKVVAISEIATSYKNTTFTISDDGTATSTVTVFRAKGLEKEDIESSDYIKAGDEVVIYGKLQNYKKGDELTPEISSCNIISINGQTSHVSAVKAEADANAPAYNLAGQKVAEGFKGLVIKGGKKMIQK